MRVLPLPMLLVSLLLACADDVPPVSCTSLLPDQMVNVGAEAHYAPCFIAETLPITLHAESGDPGVVDVAVAHSGGHVTLTGEGLGETYVTITATDPKGLSGQQHVRVIVPNRPPVIARPFGHRIPLFSAVRVALTDHIIDLDRERLVYSVGLGDGVTGVRADIAGDTLTLLASTRVDDAGIVIAATDQGGERVQLEGFFKVTDPVAYFTQAAQSRTREVPHIAGRQGLIRVFLDTDSFAIAMPGATAALVNRDGATIYTTPLASARTQVPLDLAEGDLDRSLNAFVDGSHVVADAKTLVVDIDPSSEDPALVRRIELPLDVREMPDLNLVLVPVIFGSDSGAVSLTESIIAQPASHPLTQHTLHGLPVGRYEIRGHEPLVVESQDDNAAGIEILRKLTLIASMEGSGSHYFGLTPGQLGRVAGQALLGGQVAWGIPNNFVIAHEIGHLFNLEHAPCGVDGDPYFPYEGGLSGIWGFNFSSREVTTPELPDFMGYCFGRTWISDYHFQRALNYRHQTARAPAAPQDRERVLVVWGSIEPNGTPQLEPAFYMEGVPTRLSGDSHRITGRDADGGALFTYGFSPPVVMDGPGGSAFVHMIPVAWTGSDLASIVLDAGPNGVARLDSDTDKPLSIIISDGQVRSITRDSVPPPGGSDRVIFTRGIPLEPWGREG